MCKLNLKWKSRKLGRSSTAAVSEKKSSVNIKYLNFAALKRARANNIIESNSSNQNPQSLPVIPLASPSFGLIDIDPDPNFISSLPSAYTQLTDFLVPIATPNKSERILGDAVPAHMLLSASDGGLLGIKDRRRSRNSTRSLSSLNSTKLNRRSSVACSLLSLGSFLRLSDPRPSSEVYIYAGDVEKEFGVDEMEDAEVCWIDNEFDSYSREGATTPISPMIFSTRPPSPAPPNKSESKIGSNKPADMFSSSVVSVSTEDSRVSSGLGGAGNNDDHIAHSELLTPAMSLNDSTVPGTPFSYGCNDPSDAVPAVSPIVFSDSDPSPSAVLPLTLHSHSFESEITQTLPKAHSPESPILPAISIAASPSQCSLWLSHRRKVRIAREVAPQAWTGEWNRKDMREIIRSLRELK